MNCVFHRTILAAALVLIASRAHSAEAPLTLVQKIALKGADGKLGHLAVDAKGMRLFVANNPNNTLDVVDLKTGKLVRQIPDQGKVYGVAYAGDLDMIYVTNFEGTCNGFEGKGYQRVFSAKTPADPAYKDAPNVYYHSGTKTVYVAHFEAISALDAKTGAVQARVELPGSCHGFKVDKKLGKLFVNLTNPSQIAVIDLATHKMTEKCPLTLGAAASPLAYDTKGGRLFAATRQKPEGSVVVVFDSKSGKELTSVAIPFGMDDLVFDGKRNRLYGSCGGGELVVIEGKDDKYEVTTKVETAKRARTSTYNADTGKLYLGVPKEDRDAPEIWVYEVKPVIEASAESAKPVDKAVK